MKKLILVGGPMGIGKTTISNVLQTSLKPSVWLDGDWCWQMNPWDFSHENKMMVIDNITHILTNYINHTYFKYIIFSWVMHKQSIIDQLLEQLPTEKIDVISLSLICSKEELKQRMLKDLRTNELIQTSIERLPLYKQLDTILIDTDKKDIEIVVKQIKKIVI